MLPPPTCRVNPKGGGPRDHCLCEAGLVSARVRGLPSVLLCDPLMPAGGWFKLCLSCNSNKTPVSA